MKRYFALVLIVLLVPAAFGGIVQLRKDFYNELWAPAWLIVHGRSAYDTASLGTPLPAVWLPVAIGTFAPLGWISEPLATRLWFFLSVAVLGTIVYLTLGSSPPTYVVVGAGLVAFFFPPTLNHLLLGQYSLLSALLLLLAAQFLRGGHDWAAAFAVGLGIAKPQLAGLAALGLVIQVFARSGPKGAARFVGAFLVACVALSLPVLLTSPDWLRDYIAGWQRNPPWMHPSAFVLLSRTLGTAGILLWVVLAAGLLVAFRFVWQRFPPLPAMCWTLALTTLISPYIWSWDFVLLLPLWLWTVARVHWQAQAALVLTYLIGWAGMAAVQLYGDGGNMLFWWVPWWFVGSILICARLDRAARIPGSAPATSI